jgi:hypothetical protein
VFAMKKFIVSILAFLYLGVSSGIAMEIHYCMGKKSGIDLYASSDEKCGKCGMKAKAGCCSDEHKFYKLNDSHKSVSNDLNFETPVVFISTVFPVFDFFLAKDSSEEKINNHSPPLYSRPSACILNCVFRL